MNFLKETNQFFAKVIQISANITFYLIFTILPLLSQTYEDRVFALRILEKKELLFLNGIRQ